MLILICLIYRLIYCSSASSHVETESASWTDACSAMGMISAACGDWRNTSSAVEANIEVRSMAACGCGSSSTVGPSSTVTMSWHAVAHDDCGCVWFCLSVVKIWGIEDVQWYKIDVFDDWWNRGMSWPIRKSYIAEEIRRNQSLCQIVVIMMWLAGQDNGRRWARGLGQGKLRHCGSVQQQPSHHQFGCSSNRKSLQPRKMTSPLTQGCLRE